MIMDANTDDHAFFVFCVDRAAIVSEKRRRRRESHNAVERRRRDNINEKIAELATLIPESLLDPNGLCSLRLACCCPPLNLLQPP